MIPLQLNKQCVSILIPRYHHLLLLFSSLKNFVASPTMIYMTLSSDLHLKFYGKEWMALKDQHYLGLAFMHKELHYLEITLIIKIILNLFNFNNNLDHQISSSNLSKNYIPHLLSGTHHALLQHVKLLASCDYETSTKWGQEVGFLYASVVEDVLTWFMLNYNGWRSVLCDPPKPQFLGTATTNLNDLLTQGTRWSCGLIEISLSKFCPLIFGPFKMPLLQSLCFAELTLFPLYCLPICCFATIPPLCLLHGIPLFPKVSDSCFFIFAFIFVSSQCKHLQEVLTTGGSFQKYINEQRMWMIKSTTSHLYGCLNAILKTLSLRKSTFSLTNKRQQQEEDREQQTTTTSLYQMDMFDFRTSHMFLVPMLALVSINVSCFIGGLCRVLVFYEGNLEDMLVQIFISGYGIIVSFPIIEGLVVRKDKGRVPPSVVPSFLALFVVIHLGFLALLRIL